MRRAPLALVLLALVATASCAGKMLQTTLQPHGLTGQEIKARQNRTWADQPWTGDDAAYRRIKAAIDKAPGGGQTPETLRVKYGLLAQQNPENVQAQFAWAYAAWKTLTPESPSSRKDENLYGVPEALAHVPFPRTYEFARMRFLVEYENPDFQGLGERLLARDPGDADVKYHLIGVYAGMLGHSFSPEIKQRALARTQEMLRADPRRAAYYASLGGVYYSSWINGHDVTDAQKAIAAYQQYLRLAPPTDSWRGRAQTLIGMIQKQIKQQSG